MAGAGPAPGQNESAPIRPTRAEPSAVTYGGEGSPRSFLSLQTRSRTARSAVLEPLVRQNIPGAADARIANWHAAERGLSTETFLFDLSQHGDDGPTPLKQLVFRRPPAVSLYSDHDLTRQVMVMNRLRDTPITVSTVCWLDRHDKDLGTRRTNPRAPGLAAEGFRRAAVDSVVRFDHRPQRAPAPSALAPRAAGLGDLLRRLRAVCHDVVDDVARDSVAQTDEHRGQPCPSMLIRWANLPTNWVG